MRPLLTALAKEPWRPAHVDTSFSQELGEPEEPYERLLRAAIAGDPWRFARQGSVEENLAHSPAVARQPT